MGLANIIGSHLGFANISLLAKTANLTGLSRYQQNAVKFLTYADNSCKKAQQNKSRQLYCSNASRCIFTNKQTRWTMEHLLAVAAETKHHHYSD